MYEHITLTYYPQIIQTYKEFENKSNFDNLPYLLGEIPQCAITAAIFCCLKKRDTSEEQNTIVNSTRIYVERERDSCTRVYLASPFTNHVNSLWIAC